MPSIRFENAMNWGNIITLIITVVGGVAAFTSVQSQVAYLTTTVIEMKTERSETESRLRSLELSFGRIEERLVAIQFNLQQLVTEKDPKP